MRPNPDFYTFASAYLKRYNSFHEGVGITDVRLGYTIQKITLPYSTPTRVSSHSKTIDCNVGQFEKYSRQTQIFFLLHCYYVDFEDTQNKQHMNADTKAFRELKKQEGKVYLKTYKEFTKSLPLEYTTTLPRIRNFTNLITKQNVRKKRNTSRSKK